MTLIKTWLTQRLANNAAVAELVGKDIYPIYSPQGANYPFITVIRAGTERNYVTGGPIGSDGFPKTTIHVQCWDTNYDRLEQVEDAVRYALDGARDGTTVDQLTIEDELDLPEPLITGDEFPAFGVRFVLDIRYIENAPRN